MFRYTSGPCSVPFWSMRSPSRVRFVFACWRVTALTTVHITFTMPDSPWRFDTSNPASLRFVPGASHLPIARNACPGRVGGGRIPRLLRFFAFHNPPCCFARRTPEFAKSMESTIHTGSVSFHSHTRLFTDCTSKWIAGRSCRLRWVHVPVCSLLRSCLDPRCNRRMHKIETITPDLAS